MADETLIYRGEFDNSKIVSALADTDKAYENTQKTAEKAFTGMSNADAQAAQIEKTNAAMRAALKAESADKAIKMAEKEAEAIARIQARAEQEYQRVSAQADAAEAAAGASRFQRSTEKENAYHQNRLTALAGNDAALEAEARRHDAVLTTLQADGMAKAEVGTRMVLRRVGGIGNSIQGLQMAFFGIGNSLDDTDSKFGKMIGRTGMLASGMLGLAQAYQVVAAAAGEMSTAMMIAMPALLAVGVGLAVILEHRKHLSELAKDNTWLGDPTKFAEVATAMNEAEAAQSRMVKEVSAGSVAFGNYAGMLTGANQGMKEFAEANEKLQAITGLTRDELIKLYGSLDKVKEAFESVSNSRMMDLQYTYQRAVIGAQKDGVEKSLALQGVSNEQALKNIEAHFSAVILDTKKTTKEKAKALEEEGKELALQEKINQEALAAVRHSFDVKGNKTQDYADSEARNKALASEREMQAKIRAASKKEQDEAVKEDEARTAQIYAQREKLEIAKTGGDPIKMLQQKQAQELSLITSHQAKLDAIERHKIEMRQAEKKADAELFAAKTGYYTEYANSVSQMIGIIGGKSKLAFALEQGIALGEIGMRTAVAVATDGLNPFTEWKVPYDIALGAVQAAVVAGTAIKGFEAGGYTGYGGNRDVAGVVHRNEVVWSAGDVSRAGGVDAVESMRKGSGGGPVHLGDTIVNITGSVSAAQAQEIGANIAMGKMDRLRQLKRDMKEIPYLNIPE